MLGEEEPITAQRLAQQLKDILPAEGALKEKWSQITELKTRKENETAKKLDLLMGQLQANGESHKELHDELKQWETMTAQNLDTLSCDNLKEGGNLKKEMTQLIKAKRMEETWTVQVLTNPDSFLIPDKEKRLWIQLMKMKNDQTLLTDKILNTLPPMEGRLTLLWDQLIKLKTDMERLRMLEKPKQDLQLMRLWSELEKLKKDLWEKDLTAEELVNLTSFLQYQVEKNLPEIDILVVLPAQHRIIGKDKFVLKGLYESMENNNICLIVFIKNAANLGH